MIWHYFLAAWRRQYADRVLRHYREALALDHVIPFQVRRNG